MDAKEDHLRLDFSHSVALFMALLFSCPWIKQIFSEHGHRWLYVLILSFALSFSLTPLFQVLARRWGLLDNPDARKKHETATPLLGGAAVFIAFTLGVLVNGVFSTPLLAILGGSTIMFFIGALDDFKEVSASLKLVVQIVSTVLVMWSGIVLRVFPNSLGFAAEALNVVLTFMWIVGITNAMNFFDGMDGLAGGLGAILSFFLGVLAFQTGNPFLGWISVAMMGSCLGFLPHNFRPQKKAAIFLGDGGSTFIGFVLACLAIYGDWSEGKPLVALAAPLLVFWILIFDMAHITVDRILTGKVLSFRDWLEYVGRDHLHHRIANVLGGPKRSVLFLYLLSITLGTSAVVLRNARTIDAVLLLFQASMIVILLTILERRGRGLAEKNGEPEY